MSPADEKRNFQSVIDRMKSEPPITLDFASVGKRREPTLDEARAELASSIGQIAHMIFSKKYGPLVGTVTKTTIETVLENGEEILYRAKGDTTLIIQELVDRVFTSSKKSDQ